ncbi:hypothetical protein ACLOJK_012123 [Asimina triloba]
MGFILLGGRALKEINSELNDSPLRLQVFIGATGVVYFVFAFVVPNMSSMRRWLGASTVLTFTYIAVLIGLLIKDGVDMRSKNYRMHGKKVDRVFNSFGAIAAILVCNTSGLLPEIQMFCAPIHEALDTKFLRVDERLNPKESLKRRFFLRGLLFAANTFVTAMFPFMGDFVNLFGSFTLFPLTFVFPSMIFLKDKTGVDAVAFTRTEMASHVAAWEKHGVNKKTARKEEKLWHWANAVLFSLLAVATTIAAIRLIVKNAVAYHFFADT